MAIAAGHRFAVECHQTGALVPFDALTHLRLIGDTSDPDLRAEEMRVAELAAMAAGPTAAGCAGCTESTHPCHDCPGVTP